MKATLCAVAALVSIQIRAADTLTYDQQEAFLHSAKITAEKPSKKGVTGTVRVTMTDGKITHDASVQRINDRQAVFQGQNGSTELNFKDTYLFNIAGWRLAKMLGIADMVPPSIERQYQGTSASFTWWIDDVLMDEEERVAKKISPPDKDHWDKEIQVMRVYDQLMYNTDSNATNLLIDKQWRVWMIDHTRAFRMMKTLQDPKRLSLCDRNLLAKMKTLDAASLRKEMKDYLEPSEIKGLLARRDLIVKFFESKGESALYDRPSRN
jgi:hypothetical protein